MKNVYALLAVASLVLANSVLADARLLSGDADNAIHAADGRPMDVSSDGSKVLILTGPPVSGSTPGITRGGLYVRDLAADTLTFVGVPVGGESNNNPTDAVHASMSDDARYFAWSDSMGFLFWRDHQSGTTRAITAGADGASVNPIISADGRYVAYASVARNLITDTSLLPANNRAAVYLYDSQTMATTIISLTDMGTALSTGVGSSTIATEYDFTPDGKYIVFSTDAPNAHTDRQNLATWFWTYRRDIQTGVMEVVNRNANGGIPTSGNFTSPKVDATGNRILFAGGFVAAFGPPALIDGYAQGFASDIFVKDMTSAVVIRATKTTDDSPPDGAIGAGRTAINGDGTVVVFNSSGTKFDSEDDGANFDIFRADIDGSDQVTISRVTTTIAGSENIDVHFGPFLPGTGAYTIYSTGDLLAALGTGQDNSINQHVVGIGDFSFLATGASFATWASALPEADRDLLDQPHGGVSNLERFVYGMEPTVFDAAKMPVRAVATGVSLGLTGDNNTYLTLTVQVRNDLPSGFTFEATAATTLAGFPASATPATQVGSPMASGDVNIHVFRTPFNMAGANATGFLALKISGQ